MIKITKDFETQSECNLKKAGAYEYSVHPTTRVLCLSFKSNQSKKVYLFKFEEMQRKYSEFPFDFKRYWELAIASPDVVFSAHNSFFELCIYENILVKKFGWPKIPLRKRRCTAAKAGAVAIPRNLGDAGAVMNTTTQKDYEGHRVMMKLCKPTPAWNKWKKKQDDYARKGKMSLETSPEPQKWYLPETNPEDYEKLYHYCKIDVLAEERLDESLPDLSPSEQHLWLVDQEMNFRGIQADMDLVNRIMEIMTAETKTMHKELDALTMGLVTSGHARNAILDFLSLEGLELPDLKAKTVDDFLTNGKATGDAEKLLKLRKALSKASVKKYEMFQLRGKSDGRIRDLLLFNAASTLRWGGKGIQPQNFPRGVIKDIYLAIEQIKTLSVDELKFLYGENLMPLFSSVLRGMFVATKGFDLFVEDYSAIECRVGWWLAGHEKGLDLFRNGLDPYWEMAKAVFKLDLKTIYDESEHQDMRQVGKAAVLGCSYQMGGKKFVSSAWDVYRAKVTPDMAKVAVSVYRVVHWPVTEMWGNLNDAAILAVENPGQVYRVGKIKFKKEGRFLWAICPGGRIAYADPKVIWESTFVFLDPNGEDSIYATNPAILKECRDAKLKTINRFQSKKLTYMAVNQKAKKEDCEIPKWTRERTYGGKLFENIVQHVSRNILASAIVRAREKGFKTLMHSHDELVAEAPRGKFEVKKDAKGKEYCPEFRQVMETLPTWAGGLPLKAAGWSGDRYRKG